MSAVEELEKLVNMAASKGTLQTRLGYLREQGINRKYQAKYFSMNPKSLYEIERGNVLHPRHPFEKRLRDLEDGLKSKTKQRLNETTVNVESPIKETERKTYTILLLSFLNDAVPILNDSAKKRLAKFAFDLVYRQTGTSNETYYKEILDLR